MNRTNQNGKKRTPPHKKSRAIISVFLVLAIIIVGAYAFLTATDSKTNVFTVGSVDIKLSEECDTNLNGEIDVSDDDSADEVYDASETQVTVSGEILPGQEIIKRPYVENTGKNKAWVYVTVGIPTATSDDVFRDKTTGQTAIAGTSVDIPIKAYAIQENYADKTSLEDVWNAYFTADKKTSVMGTEEKTAANLASRVPLFEILNDQRWTDSSVGNTNDPNTDWQSLGSVYRTTDGYDYYVFGYKTLLDAPATEDEISKTSFAFKGVKLLSDIGEAKPVQLNYYVAEDSADTLNGEVDLSVANEVPENYNLVKTEYYMPGSRVVSLYYDESLAKTGYAFDWRYMNDIQTSAYSGMTISDDVALIATYRDTIDENADDTPTPSPIVKYEGSGYLGYSIEQDATGAYYANLIGADETRSDYPSEATTVIVPAFIKVLKNSDGTKLLENGVIMHGSLDNVPEGTSIPVRKIQLAEWQWDSSTNNYAAPEAVALGKIAKILKMAGSNITDIKFCGDIYQHNITSGFVLEEVEIPASCTALNDRAFYSCVNLQECKIPNFVTQIGSDAFNTCKTLRSISIPNSIVSIGSLAFNNCTKLEHVSILDLSAWCKISFSDASSNPVCYARKLCLNTTLIIDLIIPDGVTNIGNYAFYNSCIKSVQLPHSVTNIGVSAFFKCIALTNITMNDGVSRIGEYAFYKCSRLTNVIVPDGVTSIGQFAFSNCTDLTSITMPDSVTNIGEEAFSHSMLTNITIPNGIKNIEKHLFSFCTSLTSITIPDSVTSIGEYAFYKCYELNITIPNSITSIGDYAFAYCPSLKEITVPDSITNIGEGAFAYCHLTNISVDKGNKIYDSRNNCNAIIKTDTNELVLGCNQTIIPDGITKIGTEAFSGCNNLKNIIIPNSVTNIGKNAFAESALENITIHDSITDIGEAAFSQCELTSVTIPSSVTSISKKTFSDCIYLTNVIISDGVTKIEDSAFSGCTGLTSVILPDSITEIDNSAFENCKKLTNIKLPENITDIGGSTFAQTGLTSITIPSKTANIKAKAFSGCPLVSISVDKNNKIYDSRNDCNAIIETVTNTLIRGCQNTVIPDDITSIGEAAFMQCQGLTSITIPKGIANINNYAFQLCTKLTTVILPEGLIKIGAAAFDSCINLKNITIPDGVKSIEVYAFSFCTSLTSITIPDSVINIERGAFANCVSLTNITLSNSITSIAEQSFDAAGLTNIIIPNGVTIIGKTAFDRCYDLMNVTIPSSVTKIEWHAFTNKKTNYIYQGTLADWAKVTCPEGSIPTGATITCTDGTTTTQ